MNFDSTTNTEEETPNGGGGGRGGGAWAEAATEDNAAAEPEGWPEAGPEWEEAKSAWEEAWPLHVYLFAVAYLLVCVVAVYFVIASFLQRAPRTSMSRTTLALNFMILSFAATRAVCLLVDPYFSLNVLPFMAARLLWSVGIPGFTASFSIMLLILLDTTKLSLAPPRFQKVWLVSAIWASHVVVVVTTDAMFQKVWLVSAIWLGHVVVVVSTDVLVMYVETDVRPMLVVCQLLFVLYGALVAVGYFYVGLKMRKNLQASSDGYQQDDQSSKLRRLVVMTFLSSAVAMSVALLNVYTAFSQFGPYADVRFLQPWPFWAVHTGLRFLEVTACSLVLMLFFRSGKGRDSDSAWCRLCLAWRKNKFVHPCNSDDTEEKEQITIITSTTAATTTTAAAIAGLMWRHRNEGESRDVILQ